ncbi:MAG: anti-sigma factor [Acaryochloridaceae cyanobacterium RL_2_7]|nr:anti-sigma factor [Acaryochloridaceae cyanobacterium RL_2_7]
MRAPVLLKDKILTAAQSSRPDSAPTPSRPIPPEMKVHTGAFFLPRWQKLLGAVALAFIALLGLQNYFLLQEVLEYSEHQDDPTTFAFSLQGKTASKAQGEVVLDLETGRALFAMQNLPALPPDQVYSLWAFMEEQPVLCGTFSVPASGQIVSQIAIPIDEYDDRKVLKMTLMRVPATMPEDLQKSLPVLTSQI